MLNNNTKEYSITIPGKFPSMNQFINANRTNVHKGNKMKQDSQNEIALYLLEQLHRVHFDEPVYLRYRFYEQNKKRDLDNISSYFHKVFQDTLVQCRIVRNDSWEYIVGFSDEFFIDNKNPRIEIDIVPKPKK